MTRSSTKKKRKRPSQGVKSGGSDSETEEHPNTNSLNKSLNKLYMNNTNKDNTPVIRAANSKEESEEIEANREIDKLLKRKIRIKDRYSYDPKGLFDDLGGMDDIIEDCRTYLDPEGKRGQCLKSLGFSSRKRLLISGVSGVGKSKLVEALINHSSYPSLKCTLARLSSGGPSEVDTAFTNLLNYAKSLGPCVIVMDKLEKFAPKRDDNRNVEREKLIDHLIDNLEEFNNQDYDDIILIGVTNKVEMVDSDFLMAARFNKRIEIDVPNDKARSDILKVLCKQIKVSSDVDFNELGFMSPGYVGADLRELVEEAGLLAVERLAAVNAGKDEDSMDVSAGDKLQNDSENPIPLQATEVTRQDFITAFKHIKPSLKRDGFASIPPVTWDDIGACELIRKKLLTSILFPVKYSAFMASTLWEKSCGILMHGPPGCGKTSIAKALANEGGINFISVKGPEILNMYVGESERRIRSIFERAAKAKPCVIFFDEIDALCAERSSSESNVTQSVLSQLLTEMDGFDNQSCKVLATTNRLDVLDSALLRPGRFDTIIYVGIPSPEAKLEILKTITRNGRPPLSREVDLSALSHDSRLKNFSGADLRGLVERAHSIATIEMYDSLHGNLNANEFSIRSHHIEAALKERGASVTDAQLSFYLKSAHKLEQSV
ncbi:nuclear valosin-containing protein-like isoform X2 [Brevipalpus obovatus]|uniref:nuclear valosin-containing protein-like isoform X2 n=1 Tax=Brevipalpus obovatus TaxID=246614 RepID=UPI003D9ED506